METTAPKTAAPVRGILIDPHTRQVTQVDVEADPEGAHLTAMYRLIGCHAVDCQPIRRGEDIFIDDEGLFEPANPVFQIEAGQGWFAGRGLVMGTGPCGEAVSTSLTAEDVKRLVKWTNVTADLIDVESLVEVGAF
jgi:hypothetical protein